MPGVGCRWVRAHDAPPTLGWVGVRLAIQASTSDARQPTAFALSRRGAGKSPRRTARQIVVRLRPTRTKTSSGRSMRSPVRGAADGDGAAVAEPSDEGGKES